MVYILPLNDQRYALLRGAQIFREPIPKAASKRDEAVIVLHGSEFTHVAHGTITTGFASLTDITALPRPLQWLEMPLIIPVRLRNHARRIFTSGGRLPPKTGAAILAALAHLAPEMRPHLAK